LRRAGRGDFDALIGVELHIAELASRATSPAPPSDDETPT